MVNIVEQSIMGFSVVILIFSSIGTYALRKPLRLWAFSALSLGILLLIYYPQQNILAAFLVALSVLYFLKSARIFAYRRKNVLIVGPGPSSFLARFFGDLKRMTLGEWLGRLISLIASVYLVSQFFPFRLKMEKMTEDLMYTAFALLMIYYVWELMNVILLHIIGPLFVTKVETRTARLKEAILLEKNIGKGVLIGEPFLFFEKDEYYVSYQRQSKRIGEIAGYICEYTVYTDLFGGEYIKDCPEAVSGSREFTELVHPEDLRGGLAYYLIGDRLPLANPKKSSLLPVLLGFMLPVLLIAITMLLLQLFQNHL